MTQADSEVVLDAIIFSLQPSGGISRYFAEIMKRMVVLPGVTVLEWDNANVARQEVTIPAQRLLNMGRARSFVARYGRVRLPTPLKRPNVYHASYYRYAANKHLKNVVTVHDFIHDRFGRGIRSRLYCELKRRAILNADHLICVSNATKADLLHFHPEVEGKPIDVIHLGFEPVRVEAGAMPLTSERPYCLFVGARGGYKNFDVAVAALASFASLDLIIVGGGRLTESEERLLDRLMRGRYRHVGAVSERALAELYSSAYALLYPSSYEGFGLPPLEAMGYGCPVIGVATSSIPEVVGSSALLLPRADPELISGALQTVGGSARPQLVAAGRLRAAALTWDRTASSTRAVYERYC